MEAQFFLPEVTFRSWKIYSLSDSRGIPHYFIPSPGNADNKRLALQQNAFPLKYR